MKDLRWLGLLACLGLAACAAPGQFQDRPVVWAVADDADIAKPQENDFPRIRYFADIILFRRVPRALELRSAQPARNVNALDEVPDSTWFINRIGLRPLTPAEAVAGPNRHGPPQPPLTVVRGKIGGANPGFFAKDVRGHTYLVKFDTKDNPEMQTATGVIVNRIFWALGYNVPSDHVFYFHGDQVRLKPGAKFVDELQQKQLMTEAHVAEILTASPRQSDGRFRAFASEFLEGVPLGGVLPEGLREDDANDIIPHQHRRELRGLRVFSAWLGHTDMKEDNTLDMYVEQDGRHFVRHYLIDFGEALGAHQAEKARYEDGWEYIIDWQMMAASYLSFGLWQRPWEKQKETPWLSIGAFGDEHFDPALWREAYPYWPFFEMDPADAFWAAKLVMRFDRPLLEAAVAEGKLSHPEAATYLVDTLLARARKIGQYWLEALTPLDAFRITPKKLCAVDLGVHYHLASHGVLELIDLDNNLLSEHTVDPQGQVCLPIPASDQYQTYRLRLRRGPTRKPPMQVHFKGGPQARILGIVRTESW